MEKVKKFKYYMPIFLQKVGYITFFILLKFFCRLEVRGRENMANLKGPIILSSNHTGDLDITAIPQVLPFFSPLYPIYYLTRPTEGYKTLGWRSYIYGGAFFNMLGGYPYYKGQKNYAVSLKDQEYLLKKGHTLCVFPEGKETRDGHLNPARGGLGYLVYATGATVVPIAFDTFFHISFWEFFTRQRKVVVTICKPMYKEELIVTDNPTVEDYQECSQKVLDVVKEKLTHNYFV